jgi:hypothetical protein
MNGNLFLTIAGMFFIPLLSVLIPLLIGERYAIYRTKRSGQAPHGAIGIVASAALGLLAFMFAFTFQIATGRYSDRKELLLTEVTNIRTTYLRAGITPDPFRSAARKYLVEYVDLRVELAKDPSRLDQALSRSQQILDSLWSFAELLNTQDRSSEAYSLYASSVNDLVDNYNQRVTMALEYRIPGSVLITLFIITFFSMLILGYQIGISGKRGFWISLLLAIVFAMVMLLILALDRPDSGLARINQKPMFTLQKQLHEK